MLEDHVTAASRPISALSNLSSAYSPVCYLGELLKYTRPMLRLHLLLAYGVSKGHAWCARRLGHQRRCLSLSPFDDGVCRIHSSSTGGSQYDNLVEEEP